MYKKTIFLIKIIVFILIIIHNNLIIEKIYILLRNLSSLPIRDIHYISNIAYFSLV